MLNHPPADAHGPLYKKSSSTNVGKLIVAKKSYHGWLHIDDVLIITKSDFDPPKFFAGCGFGWGHTAFVQARAETSDTGAEAVNPDPGSSWEGRCVYRCLEKSACVCTGVRKGPGKVAKNVKTTPHCDVTHKEAQTQNEKVFFLISTRRLSESIDCLNSFLAQSAGES